ncbi:hypothetical protein DPMN_009648 [Dreissena polymorpha]|uniref:Uncharacterized protein n=1 Tax=Dreissena polymorpha TaxID=45954 RepID=A0A9D4N0J3_DREPO|nr:hypothetical protein DPMN_009648 [Dreissena polymorpha]
MSTCLNIPGAVKDILHYSNFKECGTPSSANLDHSLFFKVVKNMYCPNSFNPDHLTLAEFRQMTFKMPGKVFRHPTSWMPPKEALQSLCELVQCQVDYLFTSFDHGSELPNFFNKGQICHKTRFSI